MHSVVRRVRCVHCGLAPEHQFLVVVNGERNSMTVTVENKSDLNVTLVGIAGSLRHPDTDTLLKNVRQRSFSRYQLKVTVWPS